MEILRQCLEEGSAVEIDGLGVFHPGSGGYEFYPSAGQKVFIAYVEEDRACAGRLYDALKASGFEPWLDRKKLLPGQNWPRAIERAIEVSDFFVACLSRRALQKRGAFQTELRYALDCARRQPLDHVYFIPLRLEEESVIGDWVRKKTTLYDYSARKILMETKKEGEHNREIVDIPPGVYYDNPLTAYYNFRYEVYGKVKPGREFLIRTVPRKGPGIFRVGVALEKEAARLREEDPEKKGKDFLVRIFLEQEFLGSPRGEIEVWFDKELNPVSAMVRKVPFIGDIKGRITQLAYRTAAQALRTP